ncbi:hypothetical protein V1522DRAFT_444168 [Lipomyces starkeyi]
MSSCGEISLPPNLQRIDPQANAVFATAYDRGADLQLKLIAKEETYLLMKAFFFTSNQFYGDAKHHHRVIQYSDTTADNDEGPNATVSDSNRKRIWFTDPDYAQLQSLRRFRRLSNQITGSIRMVADGLCYITDTEAYDGLGNNVARAAATVYVQDVVEQKSPSCKVSFIWQTSGYLLLRTAVLRTVSKLTLQETCTSAASIAILVPRGIADLCFADPGTIILLSEARIFEVKCAAQGTLVR